MQYTLAHDTFLKVPVESGTIQNLNKRAPVEVSDSAVPDTGIMLKPGESFYFRNATIYARSGWPGGEVCRAAVIPFNGCGGGGSDGGDDDAVATADDIRDIIDGYYPD